MVPAREDPLEEETAPHSSSLTWEMPWTAETGRLSPWGCKESDTTEVTEYTHVCVYVYTHVCVYAHMYEYIYTRMSICTHVYVYMYTHV